MTKIASVFAICGLFAVLGAETPASGGWCMEANAKDPRAPFGFVAAFSTELSSRKNAGQIGQSAYDEAMQKLQEANLKLAQRNPEEGCAVIEALDSAFHLRPDD